MYVLYSRIEGVTSLIGINPRPETKKTNDSSPRKALGEIQSGTGVHMRDV